MDKGGYGMSSASAYEHEYHEIRDPDFPVIFHRDRLPAGGSILSHWHGNIELLCFLSGRGVVTIDGTEIPVEPGDIAIIDANRLHQISAVDSLSYYCLIIDRGFCERYGFPVGRVRLQAKTDSRWLRSCCEQLANEVDRQRPFYKVAIQAGVLLILSRLYRNFTEAEGEEPAAPEPDAGGRQARLNMVRSAIDYLNLHYAEALTIDEICQEIGFSKYYFCRVFRAVTGKTVVDYLNLLRCEKAQYLLSSGKCNVQESAERCGFRNNSYFTKIYKRQIGELPSDTMRRRFPPPSPGGDGGPKKDDSPEG